MDDEAQSISADALAAASSALRDGLWSAVRGKPAISVIAVGNDERSSRPLFEAAHFERFRGRRVQLTLREAVEGRRRLVGELLGTERGEGDATFVVVLDESARGPVRAPLGKLLLGDKTALCPSMTTSGAEAPTPVAPPTERELQQAALEAALEAKLAKMIADDQAD